MKSNADALYQDTLWDHFTTPKRRELFGGEQLLTYDVQQILDFELAYAKCGLASTIDGLPPFSVLFTCWQRQRDSWQRVMLALPEGEDRAGMLEFLRERDAAMAQLRSRAYQLLERLEANDHKD